MALKEQQRQCVNQLNVIMSTVTLLNNGVRTSLLQEFNDPLTVEILINPDTTVWVEKLGIGLAKMGTADPSLVQSIISNVAGYHDRVCNLDHPICEAEFPVDDSRFEGLIPPLVQNPSFSLRKKATKIFTLQDYCNQGIMTERQREIISEATASKKNILIVGGTGSGKTTLINAVIEQMTLSSPNDRVIIIEDTGEIQCSAKNKMQLHTAPNTSMSALLRATLRLRPDRILVGEVRGPEALDLLDAWNTGHSGGIATLHSNTALSGLDRLKSCVLRNADCPKGPGEIEKIIGETVNYVVNIARFKTGRRINDIIKVNYYDFNKKEYDYEKVV